jgi:signal transduction histidine kinase
LDTRDLVDEIARLVEPLAEAAGATVELGSFTIAPALADRFAAGQCVRNLVDNALRYAAGRVRVGSYQEGAQIVIYVRDDGPGIPPEDLPRIFERFYRVDKARARDGSPVSGGSGLGLSIVRHLTEVQGGRAWAESRPGAGSTFSVAFPMAPESSTTSDPAPADS